MSVFYRGAKTVVVHEGYKLKPELFDIALIKFDRPFFWELRNQKIAGSG